MKIWIDADASPKAVKEIVFKASQKNKVSVTLVANSYMQVPNSHLIDLVVVEKKFDEADKYISEKAQPGDLVITADIPLAAELVDKKVVAINPRGEIYTEDNVKEALATRNLLQDLRGGLEQGGGPPPFGPKDKAAFAGSFNGLLNKLK